jgi:hypothetical protein
MGNPNVTVKNVVNRLWSIPLIKLSLPIPRQLIDQLLLERISWRGIARVTGVNWSCLQNYVNNKLAAVPRQVKVSDKPKGKLLIECDEMSPFVFSKTIKVYIWRLIDRKTRELIGGHLGYRSRQSAKKPWPSLPGVYRQCAVTYTHFWESYKTVIPSKRHREVEPRNWSK